MRGVVDYLKQCFGQTDNTGTIYTSMKKMKLSYELGIIGLIRYREKFVPEKRKTEWKKQLPEKTVHVVRQQLACRISTISVIIADADEERVEHVMEQFIAALGNGFYDPDGNWVKAEPGEAEWFFEDDHILKPKAAVQFDVAFTGGIYRDHEKIPVSVGNVEVKKTRSGGGMDGQ